MVRNSAHIKDKGFYGDALNSGLDDTQADPIVSELHRAVLMIPESSLDECDYYSACVQVSAIELPILKRDAISPKIAQPRAVRSSSTVTAERIIHPLFG